MFFMTHFIIATMFLAMISVAGVLVWGLVTMGKSDGGVEYAKKSNKMMQYRIYLQGIALALFAVVLILAK